MMMLNVLSRTTFPAMSFNSPERNGVAKGFRAHKEKGSGMTQLFSEFLQPSLAFGLGAFDMLLQEHTQEKKIKGRGC